MSVGQPTKLTPDVQKRIIDAIRDGAYAKVAVQYGGIAQSTYYGWLERGRAYEPGVSHPDDVIYLEFLEAVKAAEAEAELQHIGIIRQAADEGCWRASAWWLERKFPKRWGRKDRREISGPDGGPIQQNIGLSDEMVKIIKQKILGFDPHTR